MLATNSTELRTEREADRWEASGGAAPGALSSGCRLFSTMSGYTLAYGLRD